MELPSFLIVVNTHELWVSWPNTNVFLQSFLHDLSHIFTFARLSTKIRTISVPRAISLRNAFYSMKVCIVQKLRFMRCRGMINISLVSIFDLVYSDEAN